MVLAEIISFFLCVYMVVMVLVVERIGLEGGPGVCLRATEAWLDIRSAGEHKDTECSQGSAEGIWCFMFMHRDLAKAEQRLS